MTGGEARYAALAAKARTLYARRLGREDFRRLAALGSPGEILEALGDFPAWASAAEALPPGSRADGGAFGGLLEEGLRREYEGLLCFLPRQDAPLMAYPVRRAEGEALLWALRRLNGAPYGQGLPPPFRLAARGRVDLRRLAAATGCQEVAAAGRGSIYYPALLRLGQPDGAPPSCAAAEPLLQGAFFSHIRRILLRQYRGDVQAALLRLFGAQADLRSLLGILRLKTYFPRLGPEACLALLLPRPFRVNGETLRALCAAPDAGALRPILDKTPYAAGFAGADPLQAEARCRRLFHALNRRLLLTAPPSVCTAVAYLNLKELECAALGHLLQSAAWGVLPDSALLDLAGG